MNKNLYILILILGTASAVLGQGNRYYVHQQAAGANNGQSWTDAFTDLQNALQLAQPGDEIWVAKGNYLPTSGTDRTIALEPKSGVKMYGGFAGTEAGLDERDWAANPTLLSGDIGLQDDSIDNSYTVLYLHLPDSNTVLDGFILRDGVADSFDGGAFDRAKCGGGLYIMGRDWEAYPAIRNCIFEHNTAKNYGGGVMVNGTGDGSVAPQFFNCIFKNNNAGVNGGGMAQIGAGWVDRQPDMDSCIFERNIANNHGGGLYLEDANRADIFQFDRLHFINNKAMGFGGGAMISLGRSDGNSNLVIQNSTFRENASFSSNPAVYITVRQFYPFKSVELFNCIFSENDTIPKTGNASGSIDGILGIVGFGVDKKSTRLHINKCAFIGNTNKNLSKILDIELLDSERFVIENSIFSNNIFTSLLSHLVSDGTISLRDNRFFDNESVSVFGGYYFRSSLSDTLSLNNCIFKEKASASKSLFTADGNVIINNSVISEAPNGLAVNESFLGFSTGKKLYISNSAIIGGKRFAQALSLLNKFDGQGAYLSHCYFDTLDCTALPTHVTCGPGMLTGIDPMFVNPDSGDYRLQPCSPLINAGNNNYVLDTTDLAGLPRIQSDTVDIGALESQGPALAAAPQTTPSCPGGASGSVNPEVQDACLPVSFQWQSGAGSGSQLDGLLPGDYQFTITDSRGQTGTFSVSIPVGDVPALVPLATPVLCGDTLGGAATALLNPGLLPLQYLWADGSTDSLHTGLAVGAFTVTVTDANGCSVTGSVQVHKTGNLGVDIEVQEISCYNAADGIFTVLPANGKAPFSWLWESGEMTAAVGPLGPGSYAGTLTDAFGCTIQWVLPLSQPDSLQLNASIIDASDTTAANGSIELAPSGGTAPYEILWSTGATDLALDSLPPGMYSVTITDEHDCSTVETYVVGITSSIGEPWAKTDFVLFPNPTTGQVWLQLKQTVREARPIRIWNIAGQEVLHSRLAANSVQVGLQLGKLPQGLYFVQIGDQLRKLVIN